MSLSRKNTDDEDVYRDRQRKYARRKRRSRAIARWMWISTAIFVVCLFTFFILIYNGTLGYMPPVKELKNPRSTYASIIYSADGTEMGRFFGSTSNRVYADFDSISNYVFDALVATEDVRYLEHSGIDFNSLPRVIFKNVIMGQESAGGGSTITQQLAKQLYSTPTNDKKSRLIQKPIEWMIAVKLERYYSKEEIIKMYLNQFDFLNNAVGIQSAAQIYFNKKPKNLNLQESALLVGMVKNPNIYNPKKHPEKALQRRNVVLDQMYKAGKISIKERDSVSRLPIELNFQRVNHKEGMAPYFREEVRRYLTAKRPVRSNYPSWDYARYVTDSTLWADNRLFGWIEKNPKPDGTLWDLYTDGLRIFTTIDDTMQEYAEEAVEEQLKTLQKSFDKQYKKLASYPYVGKELSSKGREKRIKALINQSERARVARARGLNDKQIEKEFNTKTPMTLFSWAGAIDTVMTPRDSILYTKGLLRAGFVAMDPRNGYVKAYVGGADFNFFQYDMVSLGKRQVGSTIKPFLYTLALENGKTPCSTYLNSRPVIRLNNGQTWSPRNSSYSRVGQQVNLKWALTTSNNWISARIIDELGTQKFIDYLGTYGISSKLPVSPSLSLGVGDISLLEMTSAYTTFANGGMRSQPIFVRRITDKDGNVLADFDPNQTELITRTSYYRILSMLLNVVQNGTGSRLRRNYGITAQTGGKTGTTNDNSDGWFFGFTPSIVAGAWVGGDDRYIHFQTTKEGQGAATALPIYANFMKKVYADETLDYNQNEKFTFPADYTDCDWISRRKYRTTNNEDTQQAAGPALGSSLFD